MRFARWARFLLAVLILASGATAALAQGTTSRVTGTVTDSTGAYIPGATVTLTNEATGVSFTTTTSNTGVYVFDAVQVGRYTVAVELQGFKKFVATATPVNIGVPTTLNAVLEAGGITETVEVNAASTVVQTSTSGNLGSTFDQRTIESLPIMGLRGRNPLELVLTQPGVVSGANTGGGSHVNGARDRSWNFTLDGIDTNETSAGGALFSPLRTNPDALAEFKVLTGNQTAEFGRNSGGQVAMVTRSGSNKLSGTAFYFDRRPGYNANEWESNLAGTGKVKYVQNMPGFSVGGPIQRNKTFFFVNAQWLRADQTQTVTRTVYTDTARRGIWRFNTAGRNQPFGSPTPSVDAGGNPIVPIASYDIIANDPQRRGMDPTVQGFIAKTPLPNNFAAGDGLNTAGYDFSAPTQERQMDFVTKVDHTFNARNSAFLRWSKGYQDTNCDAVNGGLPAFPGTTCFVNTTRSPYNWAANYRWNPGSNIVNELVVGQNHFTFDFVSPMADPSRVSLTSTPIQIDEDYQVGNLRTVNTFQVVDNFSWFKGAHTVRFGTNMRFQRHTDTRGSVASANVSPVANFSTTVNAVDTTTFGIPSTIQIANDLPALRTNINFLLGRIGNITQGFVQRGDSYAPGGTLFNFDSDYPEIDFYGQDTWKPRPNLTVDLGLRWEAKLAPRNPDDLIRRPNQSLAVGQSPSNTLRWDKGSLYEDDWNNIAPSVGAAWDPTGTGKSVIRGNYRMAFDRINTFVFSSNIFQNIPGIALGVNNTDFGQGGGRLRDGLPALQPTLAPADFLQPPSVGTGNLRVVDPDFQTPTTHAWAITYQRQLFKQTLVEVAYIGRRAEHLYGAYNVNQADIFNNGFLEAYNVVQSGGESALMNQLLAPHSDRRSTETGSQMVRRLFATNLALNSVAALASTFGARVQGGRQLTELAGLGPYFFFPYPQFLGSVNVIDSEDYSRYHALALKLERRFADGVSYLVGYTLSRSKDTRSYDPAFTVVSTANNQSASSTPFNIFDRSLNYALSDFDRTHVLQAQGVWELPFGQGRRFASDVSRGVDMLVGGWTISGQFTAQSGRPMTVYGGSNTLSNIVQTPANCSGCSSSFGSVHEEDGIIWYFTPEERAKFSTPAPGEMGNTGRNAFRGPGGWGMDLSIAKRTRIVGNQILEIRADSSNVLNHPTFGFPTLTTTSSIFGRIRDSVTSGSRKIMLGVKYYF